ncbi:MAG: amino acid adenylation domain-containing protein [Candidatus Thiothrix moscowensis]|nr:amino acid adenylation domain-containing protein [Candidatus Thiothrix moscowensis]
MTASAFPLSSAQREIWFDQMLHSDMPLYNVGGYLHIPGVVNVALLVQALQLLVHKHDALRIRLLDATDEDGVPLQTFVPQLALEVGGKDFTGKSLDAALVWMQARLEEPFALTQQPLFRCDLLQLAEDDYYCLLQYHHLIADGWGVALVARSLAEIYSALAAGAAPVMDSPSYTEFIRNDRSYVESPAFQRDRDFWLAQYPSPPDHLLVRNGASRVDLADIGVSACQAIMMPRTLYQRLEDVAQQYQATVFQMLLGALYVYFARTSQQSAFAVGLPVLNRANARFKQTAGLFVGVSPVLLRSDRNASFAELLQTINTTLKAVYRHQRFPLSEIQRLVSTQPDVGTLFEVNLSFQKLDYDLSFAGIPARNTLLWSRWEQSPLVVHVQDFLGHENVKLDFVYNHAYFNAGDIARLQTSFMTLLEAVAGEVTLPLRHLPIMSDAAQQQLAQWSGQDAGWADAADGLISQQFAAQAERTPNAVAVVDADTGQQLTYRELNTRANQLAHYLRTQGIGADMPVGLCVERSADMLVGLLGILKAGAVYLPIDPAYPAERTRFMLEQAQVRLVLSQQAVMERVFTPPVLPADTALLALDSQWSALMQQPVENPALAIAATQLAYLIYTSGSTGQPKGVMVEHGALASHTRTMQQHFGLGANDRVLQFASMSFDVALEQILPALISGASVVIAQPHWSLDAFTAHLQAQHVTVFDLPPAYLHQVLAHWQTQQWQATPASLRLMIVGNEVVPPETVALWRQMGRGIRLLNAYGPTEATITATCHELDAAAIPTGKVPIGRPLPGKTAYVLDNALQPLPIGVAGELYLGGSGVARGYWQRDDLTAERFLANPFGAGRLYRTGDLARWLPDGTLEFIGRVDHQVKLRGFRIELGEIGTLLAQHAAVQEAAVIVREDQPGQKRLVAYWTAKPSAQASNADIMQHLQAALPAYMVPAVCVLLAAMPQTANGKINRKALPIPAETEAANDSQYVAPTQPVEQQLADIWASVLGRESVGIHDNFFALGGDSILSLQVVSRARQQGLLFQPKQLFQYQTIAQLASVVEQLTPTTTLNTQSQVSGKVELTPVQHWFFAQDFAEAEHHNLAFRAEIAAELAPETLTQAWRQVSLHHDALRSRFVQQDGQWRQSCAAEVGELTLAVIDLSEAPEAEQPARWERECCRLQASLNLATGELQRMALFHFGAQQPARLFWCIHHLVVDGVSWRVLLEDLQTACAQLQQGQGIRLPAKTTAFQTWAAWLAQNAAPYVQADLVYWQGVCAHQTVPLAADYPANITANTVASQAHVVRQLSVADTRSLLQDAHQAYHTQVNDLLLTALAQAYQQRTGQSRLRLDLEGHGREVLDTPPGGVAVPAFDLSRTVGWFTSIYPQVLTLPAKDMASAIKAVKEQLRAIPNRGMGYGILRYLGKVDGLAGQAELCFNYLGQFDASAADTAVLRHAMLDMATQPHSLQQQRPYVWEINCLVVDGQLQVDCAYSTALHQAATVEAFADAFMSALQTVLAHCRDPQAGGYTSSDFAQAKLKQNQLDQLLNRIKVNKRK